MKGTRIIYLSRKLIAAAACAAAAAVMFWAVNNPAVVGASAATRQLPIYCVQKDYKVLSISFDAAWGNEDTQQLIDIMARYNIKATFFVVGEWVDKYPQSVRALADAGHEVMSHSNTHAHFNSLSSQEIIDDLNTCGSKIEAVTGVRPTLFRCPYGEYDDHVINAVRSLGIEPIQWDVERSHTASSGWDAAGMSGRHPLFCRFLQCPAAEDDRLPVKTQLNCTGVLRDAQLAGRPFGRSYAWPAAPHLRPPCLRTSMANCFCERGDPA